MKKIATILLSCGILGGCASYQPMGTIYSGGTTGLSANNNVQAKLIGKACMHSVISLVAFGDGSIETAKRNAGITKVASVDYDVQNILGVWGSYCTVVKGE